MGKLTFVGIGLGAKGITLEGIEAIKESEIVYLEYYTSPHEPKLVHELSANTGKEIIVVSREFVEDGKEILGQAAKKSVVLAVPGDPMIATTHTELRVRAIKMGIETRIVHSASIASAALSVSGLHFYKFGGAITCTVETINKMDQIYREVHKNLQHGKHTMILLEYSTEKGSGVKPEHVFEGLLRAEKNYKKGVIKDETFAIVLSRIGRGDSRLIAGKFIELRSISYGEPPHCIILPSSLHFTEREAISAIFSVEEKEITDNSSKIKRTAEVLVPRYVEKTKKVIESIKSKVGKEYSSLIENAEIYSKDAQDFLANGEDELAMLSIGYAEGLLDSLNFTGAVKIEW